MSKRQFVISVMTRDRVGIIADVSGLIRNLGGNLADLSQTVLCGHFTMILLAEFPPVVTEPVLRQELRGLDADVPFEVGIKEVTGRLAPDMARWQGQYVVTAVGPDSIGLVAAISEFMRGKGVNIVDFTTHVASGNYTMILAIDLPPQCHIANFRRDLREAMSKVGVSVEIQHRRIFVATNEV